LELRTSDSPLVLRILISTVMSSAGKKRVATADQESGRDRKKAKLVESRHIPVQNVVLPNSVNIERFIEVTDVHVLLLHSLTMCQARAFEINAMESAMKSARCNCETASDLRSLIRAQGWRDA
jgi:hypothetical protein